MWEVLVAGGSAGDALRRSRWGPTARTLGDFMDLPGMVITTDNPQETKVVTNNPQEAKVVKKVYTSGAATPKAITTRRPASGTKAADKQVEQSGATTTWKSVATRRAKTTTLPPGLEVPNRSHTTTHNMFAGLQDDHTDVNEVETCGGGAWTRLSSMTFNLAGVTKPLASAAQVVASGNRIILDPKPECSYVENVSTGERMGLREQKGVYVFDVQYHNGQEGTITLDSGAGVSVWPKDWTQHAAETLPRKPGLKLVAANGTPIENVGRARVVLKGKRPGFSRPSQ